MNPQPISPPSFASHTRWSLVLLFGFICAFGVYVVSEKAIDRAYQDHIRSIMLADELRQSSDDLTLMARLYVVTGDLLYRQYFQQIADIRDGRRSRPERYEGVFWDFAVAQRSMPRPDSDQVVPLLERMRQAGFRQEELRILGEAIGRSDALIGIEHEAMRLREAFDAGNGTPDSVSRALALMHDQVYLDSKMAIMVPIDEVYKRVFERTQMSVERAERNAALMRLVFIAFGVALLLMLYRTSRFLHATLGGPVERVDAMIAQLERGGFALAGHALSAPPDTVMGRLEQANRTLGETEAERVAALQALHHSESRLKEAQALAKVGHWELDHATQALIWSDEIFRIFDMDPASVSVSYATFLAAVHPDDRQLVTKVFEESVRNRTIYGITHRILLPNGVIKYVLERGETLYDEQGRAQRSIGTVQDVTESRHAELKLQRLNRELRLISQCNMALVRAQDEQGLLNEICRLCVEKGGYKIAWVGFVHDGALATVQVAACFGTGSEQLLDGTLKQADTLADMLPTAIAIRSATPQVIEDMQLALPPGPWRDSVVRLGLGAAVSLPLLRRGNVLGALTLYSEQTQSFSAEELRLLMELAGDLGYGIEALRTRLEHEQAQSQLEFLAHFDPLTRLPNRLLLRDRFEQAVRASQSASEATVAMCYLDLDRFKQINEGLGYAIGDQVLLATVDRLHARLPRAATVSRLNADEFVVLLSEAPELDQLADLANALREAISEPLLVDVHTVNVSCSIGIALFPADGQDFETLLKHAHSALDSAKESGRDACQFFSSSMNAGLSEQIRLTGGFASALRQQEFVLHYQPQFEIASGRLVGVEALLRWQHPEDGLLAPGRFIGLAERSGHIVPIGEWVLHEACRQGKIWHDTWTEAPLVAVNLSALQFKRGNVLALVKAALAGSGMRPELLELELTESILLQDIEATMQTLHELKGMGVKLSIDDFGTGYSSLAYLKQLSVDKIKVDQSFVRDMLLGEDGASIVKAIIQLGHVLELDVIAEGVETDAQLDFLAQAGCDQVQGYLFGRPALPEALDEQLGRPH